MKRTYILLKVSRDSGEVNKLKNVMKYSKHGKNIIHTYIYMYIYIYTHRPSCLIRWYRQIQRPLKSIT